MLNNIIDSVRECQLQSVVGGVFRRGTGGTTITLKAGKQQEEETLLCPFTPIATAVTSGYEVTFQAGTINGLLPTNMFDALVGVTTAAVNYFYLKCISDGKLLTSAVIEKTTSVRTPQASNVDTAPAELNVLIGYMTTGGVAIRTIPCSNITARIFPTVQEDNVSYVAGERNFKQYYSWGI